MAKISEFCQRGEHDQCPIQQPYDHDHPTCQCECHPKTMPGTTEGGEGM
jgi:hypothetical protein